MIILSYSGPLIRVIAMDKIEARDFTSITPEIEEIIKHFNKIKLFIDARKFKGWNDKNTSSLPWKFIKKNKNNMDQIAVITDNKKLKRAVKLMKILLKINVNQFEPSALSEAEKWIGG